MAAKTKMEFKKEMRDYFNIAVDPEPGETFEDWFSVLWDALKSDGKIKKQGNKYIVLD